MALSVGGTEKAETVVKDVITGLKDSYTSEEIIAQLQSEVAAMTQEIAVDKLTTVAGDKAGAQAAVDAVIAEVSS